MQMRMVHQILSPSVQDSDEADLGPQMFRIGGDRAQGFGGGAKQEIVDHRLVLIGHRRDHLGQRKDHVEILHRNEIGLAIFQPLRTHQGLTLRAMAISATVEGNAPVTAGIALLDVFAKRGGTATLDGAHDAALPTAECRSVLLTVEGPGLAKDVRHLEPGGTHVRSQK